MTGSATLYGLLLLWIGAVAFGTLVLLRDRWRAGAVTGGSESMRKGIEAACLFAGSLGMISGLGILSISLLR